MRACCRKKLRWFLQGSLHGETKHLRGSLAAWSGRIGLDRSAIAELEDWEQGTDSAPFPCRRQFSPSEQTSSCPDSAERGIVTPQKVAPELLSPRLSTEPPRAQPKRSPRRLWSRVDAGGIVEGGLGRRWVSEPEGRKREGVRDTGRSRKMWVLSTRKLASHQTILGSAWRGYYCFHSCCRAVWLPGIARSFPELLLQSNIHMNWSGRQKTPLQLGMWPMVKFNQLYKVYFVSYCFK